MQAAPQALSRLPVRKFWKAVRPPPAPNVNEPWVMLVDSSRLLSKPIATPPFQVWFPRCQVRLSTKVWFL